MMATGFPKTSSNLLLKYKIITFDIKLAATIITIDRKKDGNTALQSHLMQKHTC
jgi:hypothetical protein